MGGDDLVVCIDVGGTFTDFVVVGADGVVLAFKMLTDVGEPDKTVIAGLRRICEDLTVGEVLHATTIATNVLLGQERLKPPKVALLTTKGFKDVVEIGRQNRPRLYDLDFKKPRPLVPRSLRFEVDERTSPDGSVVKVVDPREVEEVLRRLEEEGVESVAIVFLHSYANPANERKAKEVVERGVGFVSASSEVAPEPREYERTTTTIINSILAPIVSRYLDGIESRLSDICGTRPRLGVMASSGGLITLREAKRRPVQLIESGPAAGVIAAAELAKQIGLGDVISFDMGGTTAKVGTVVNYSPTIVTEYEVGGEVHYGRIVKGSGYPVLFPFIDLVEVSAGGGTIIWVDEGGALRVGPMSAGSNPGPVCYGRGGSRPTITDSNLVLGRIGDKLLGGEMVLDKELAVKYLSRIGDPVQTARASIDIINLRMARAIRLATIERGYDPGGFTLVAFGGAGPQHATGLAEEMGIKRIVVPWEPGEFSSLGLAMTDVKFEARRSGVRVGELEEEFLRLEAELVKELGGGYYFLRYADVRYEGQGWDLIVEAGRPTSREEVERRFREKHERVYGFKLERRIEVTSIRVFAIRPRVKPRPTKVRAAGRPKVKEYRRVFLKEWVEAPVYDRLDLPPGFKSEGPLVVEEYGSTTVVPDAWSLRVDETGVLVLEH